MVAAVRGAKFEMHGDGFAWPVDYDGSESSWITREAMKDVKTWLGFTSDDEYLDALEAMREKIFLRAKD